MINLKCQDNIDNNALYKIICNKTPKSHATMSNVDVILIEVGTLVKDLHYGPFSRYWWEVPSVSDLNICSRFPIRVGQKTKTRLNERDFYITIHVSTSNKVLPEYYCQSDDVLAVETSATKAISKAYQKIFRTKTRYSGHIVLGWNNKKIIDILSTNIDFYPLSCQLGTKYEIFIYELGSSTRLDWNKAGNGYKSSIIFMYKKRSTMFVSEINDNKCYVNVYQDLELQETFVGNTPDDVWKNLGYIQNIQNFSGRQLFGLEDQITLQMLSKLHISQCTFHKWRDIELMNQLYEYHLQRRTSTNVEWYDLFVRWNKSENSIIELSSELKLLYPPEHQFSDRELGAWLSMLRAAGCTDITPWTHDDSEV